MAAIHDGATDDYAAIGISAAALAGPDAPLPADACWVSGAAGEGENIGLGTFSTGDFDGDENPELLAGWYRWEDDRGRYFLTGRFAAASSGGASPPGTPTGGW